MFHLIINTTREITRNRFYALIAFLIVALVVSTIALDSLALGQSEYIVVDFWLSFIEISGLLLLLFLGSRLLTREFEEKTIYLTLSRPIERWVIIGGKFFGFAWVLFLLIMIEMLVLMGLMHWYTIEITGIFFLAIFGIWLKLCALLSLSLLFSVYLSTAIVSFGVIAAYIIGHSGYALLEYSVFAKNALLDIIARGILIFFPNLSALNTKNLIHTPHIDLGTISIGYTLAIIYILIILVIAGYSMKRKNFDTI